MRPVTRRDVLLAMTVAAAGCRRRPGPQVVTLAVAGMI